MNNQATAFKSYNEESNTSLVVLKGLIKDRSILSKNRTEFYDLRTSYFTQMTERKEGKPLTNDFQELRNKSIGLVEKNLGNESLHKETRETLLQWGERLRLSN